MTEQAYEWSFSTDTKFGNGDKVIHIPIAHYDTPHAVNNLKRRLDGIRTELNLSKPKLYQHIFWEGMKAIEKQLQSEGIEVNPEDVAVSQRLEQIENKEQKQKDFDRIYESEGLAATLEFYEGIGVDCTPYLQEYQMLGDHDKAIRIRKWLYDFLSDGEPRHAVDTIKPLMIDQGIIDDTDGDWQLVKTVASKQGFSSQKVAPKHFWRWFQASKVNGS